MTRQQHAKVRGILSVFGASAYLIGPLIAEQMIDKNHSFPFLEP